jgi:hypothetical protein
MSGSPRDSSGNINSLDGSGNSLDGSGNSLDGSGNRQGSSSGSSSGSSTPSSSSSNVIDLSLNIPVIVNTLSGETIVGVGYEIKNAQGTDASGAGIAKTTFDTTNPELYDPQIHQNLSQKVETYNDISAIDSSANILLNEIKLYAGELKCSDFHGKGTIDDYSALFTAASRIANETKQMELDVDIAGFNEFAQAADDMSDLFNGFILKLQNVSIITDIGFLTSIAGALRRLVKLSETFGRFKQTVLATTAIQLPKSAHETKLIIDGVMEEVNCAMKYIEYFVSPTDLSLSAAALSVEEKHIIAKSVETIDNWNTLCQYGVSIAMSSDVDIISIHNASEELKQSSVTLRSASSRLRAKLAAFNII